MAKDATGPPRPGLGRRDVLAGAAVSAAAGLSGCVGVLAGEKKEVNVAGSSTVFPVTEVVASEFADRRDDVTVSISQTGTGGGFSNFFCPGMTDVNNASREIADAERDQCADNGIEPIRLTVATDALTVVVNPEATWVDCLTVEELRDIWRMDGAERWSDVRDGWPDEEFELFGADTTSGTYDYFSEAILGEEDHRVDYHPTERDRTIVQGVRGNRHAMGYFGFAYYSENPDQIEAVPVENDEGECVAPSRDAAKEGRYTPLSRPLFIYVSDRSLARPEVQDFARFYLEQAATETVTEVGYVPITEDERDENLDRLDAAIEEVTER